METKSFSNEVKIQISFAVTGSQPIICPQCGQSATAHVGRKQKGATRRTYRKVHTSCRHCGTSIIFDWK